MPVSKGRKQKPPQETVTEPQEKKPDHATIWVDGSIRNGGQSFYGVGAGWVMHKAFYDHKGRLQKVFEEHRKPLENENSGSSLAAEFRAAALAIKEAGQHVTLHTDCQAVRKFLETGVRPKANRGTPEQQKYLDGTVTQLLNATRNKSIVLPPTRRKKSDQTKIDRAHELANQASAHALKLQKS